MGVTTKVPLPVDVSELLSKDVVFRSTWYLRSVVKSKYGKLPSDTQKPILAGMS